MEEALKEEMLPKIMKGLEKPLVKMFQNFSLLDEQKALQLVRVIEHQEQGTIKKEEAEAIIGSTMSDKQKRIVINKFYNNLKRSTITWWDAVRLLKLVEHHMQERDKIIQDFKNLKKTIEKKNEMDAKSKEYINSQLNEYNTENPTWADQILAAKFNAGDPVTIADYYTDTKVQEQIDAVNKPNINSLNNDEIQQLTDYFRHQVDQGIDEYKYYKKQEKQYIDDQIEKTRPNVRKEDFAENIYETETLKDNIKKRWNKKSNKIDMFLDDMFTPVRGMHELWLATLKEKLSDKPFRQFLDQQDLIRDKYIKERNEIQKKYGKRFTKADMLRIREHGLANKDKNTWRWPLIAYLEDRYPGITKKEVVSKIETMKQPEYLNPMQTELQAVRKDIFDMTADKLAPVFEKDQNKMFPREVNYEPVMAANAMIEKTPQEMDIDSLLDVKDLSNYAVGIKKWFTKQAKGSKTLPIMDAEVAMFQHVNWATYYSYMQEPLKQYTAIVKWLKDDLWKRGYRYVAEYIARMKKQGNINKEIDPLERFIEWTLSTLRKWVILTKIPLVFMHIVNTFRSYWVTGKNPIPALWEIINNKSVRDEIRKQSGHIRHRNTDDPDYTAEDVMTYLLWNVGKKIEAIASYPLKMADRLTASTIFWTVYKWELTKIGKTPESATPEEKEDASLKADTAVIKTIDDPSFAGLAKFTLESRWYKKFLTQFSNFITNQASQVRGTAWRTTADEKSEARANNKSRIQWHKSLVRMIFVLGIAWAVDEAIREWYKLATTGKNTRQRKVPADQYKMWPLDTLEAQIPLLSQAVSLFQGDTSIQQYGNNILNKNNYKNMDKFTRKVLFSLGRLMWVPVNPIEDIYNILSPKQWWSGKTRRG